MDKGILIDDICSQGSLVIIAESLALKIPHNAPVLSIDLRYPLCLAICTSCVFALIFKVQAVAFNDFPIVVNGTLKFPFGYEYRKNHVR